MWTSVSPNRYLMIIVTLKTTVMLTPIVPTLRVPSFAPVIWGILVMESRVSVNFLRSQSFLERIVEQNKVLEI